jgi:hypothetical protein
MTPQPDKLIREALEEFRRPAPASAWDRIETGLDQRKPHVIWWKIAAGMLLLLAASFMLWPHHKDAPSVNLGQQNPVQKELKSNTPMATAAEVPIVPETPMRKAEIIPDNKIKSHSIHNRSMSKDDVVDVEDVPNEIKEEESVVTATVPIEIMDDPEPEIEAAFVSVLTNGSFADETPARHMKYTAKEVNARFMKKSVTPEATPEKKSTSGVKKVIDVAIGLKNNDSLISDLRQLKNEYLTINFPDKKRDPTK